MGSPIVSDDEHWGKRMRAQILQQVQDERSEEVYPEFIEGSAAI